MELCEKSNVNNFITSKEFDIPLPENVYSISVLFTLFDEKRIWLILSQCLLGLATLKSFNIIHGDIKGENIFIAADNSVKIGILCLLFYMFF
jgi:serine/threonine protein kinase